LSRGKHDQRGERSTELHAASSPISKSSGTREPVIIASS
jgi:hypothetical protein